MELDKALRFAVILAWDDLMKASEPSSVRVEYQGKSGIFLDRVSVWSAKAWGYHDLVCDYWTSTSFGPSQRALLQGRTGVGQVGRDTWLHHEEPESVHASSRCRRSRPDCDRFTHRRGTTGSCRLDEPGS